MDIDFIVPWVDGTDHVWLRRKKAHQGECDILCDDDPMRYRDWGLMKYWFRCIEENAPWVHRVLFVTEGHTPAWLNVKHPRLRIVKHEEFIPGEYLPTFNSAAIELNIHRIEGLSDHFVLFNDDMYIGAPVQPQDFFKKGQPCDVFALGVVQYGSDTIGTMESLDMRIINDHFNKSEAFRRHWKKWLSPRNGLVSIRNTIKLMSWKRFSGFYCMHLPNSFLKSTFETLWDVEYGILDYTCSCRFRREDNVNQWAMKYWQLADGAFVPRTPYEGFRYFGQPDLLPKMCKAIENKTFKLLCVNDSGATDAYEKERSLLVESFERAYPSPSSFERNV